MLGVAGAGTMGAGITQVAVLGGIETLLYDPDSNALESSRTNLRSALSRGVEKGRWSRNDADAATARLHFVDSINSLAVCSAVIEAVPEDFGIKQAVLSEAFSVCGDDTLFASNTSSIPITALASELPDPSRFIGMHFFNPVPLMKLVEVIPGALTHSDAISRASDLGRKLGKHVVIAQDGPGFIVNRCGRPFYYEALRLLQEGIATFDQIDRICRLGGEFRMGPFELMDLVGIDVAFDVARSFDELSFGEPRWRPTAMQARMARSGNLGRKSGRGWYSYASGPHRPSDPEPPEVDIDTTSSLAVLGQSSCAGRIRKLAATAGLGLLETGSSKAKVTLFADAEVTSEDVHDTSSITIVSCAARSLAARGLTQCVGFSMNLTAKGLLVELARTEATPDEWCLEAESLFRAMGLHTEWVKDGPGLVLNRMLTQIVNEGAFALGEGVAKAADIDDGVRLGLNYPSGPIELGDQMGWGTVRTVLDGLWEERREERYRPAPKLIDAASGLSLRHD